MTVETASKATLQLHKKVSVRRPGSASLLLLPAAGSEGARHPRALQPAFLRGADPTLPGTEKPAGWLNTTPSRSSPTSPEGDGPDLEAPPPPGLDGHPSGGLACAATRPTGMRRACLAPTPLSPTWKRCFAPEPHLPSQAGGSEGHLFLTVIAYQLVQVIRKRLKQRGDPSSWTTLRRILEGQQRVTVTFRRGDGRTLHVRKATRAETDQKAISTPWASIPLPEGSAR